MAPRQKRPRTTESSSSAQARNILSSQQYAKDTRRRLEKMDFITSQYMDWDLLDDFGIRDRVMGLIQDPAWLRIFEWREPAYKNLTLEVLSTLKVESDGDRSKFVFQAYGAVHEIRLKSMGRVLGLYAEEADNLELPNSWPKGANAMNQETYWFQLIAPLTDPFVASKSVASTFSQVEHKVLHHIIAHTISCKKTSHSKVTSFDVFYLFSIITNFRIDLGVEVANFIFRQADDTRTKFLCCGGYITKLLKGMNIFQEPEGDVEIPSKRITSAPFRGFGLVKVPRGVPPPPPPVVEEQDYQDIFPGDIPIELPPPPASSSAPPPSSDWDRMASTLERLERGHDQILTTLKKEKQKNKGFRKQMFQAIKEMFCCISPEKGSQMHYETSPDEESSSSTEAES